MKVLSIVTQLEAGGAQTVALSLHRELQKRGVDSQMCFLYEKGSAVFDATGCTVLLRRKPNGAGDYLAVLARLRSLWRSYRPTHIICHTHYAITIAVLLKLTGAKGHVVAVHQNVRALYPSAAVLADYLGGTLGLYRHSVAVSGAVADTFQYENGMYKSRQQVIPNETELQRSALDKAAARRKFGLPADRFVLGNAGRLSEQKNQAFLVGVMTGLGDAHLVIAGEGPLHGELAACIEDHGVGGRVKLFGTISHADMPDFFRAIDVLVFPSLHEGRSLVMLEAMVNGVPIVAHDTPTITSVIVSGDSPDAGIVLPLDRNRWIDTLLSLENDPELRSSLGEAAQRKLEGQSHGFMTDAYIRMMTASPRPRS